LADETVLLPFFRQLIIILTFHIGNLNSNEPKPFCQALNTYIWYSDINELLDFQDLLKE